MLKTARIVASMAAVVCSSTLAPPTCCRRKHGIYVPANRPCKGASKAEIVNYWDDKSSFGSALATCTISKLKRDGSAFAIADKCADIRGGGEEDSVFKRPFSFPMAPRTRHPMRVSRSLKGAENG